MPVYFPPQTCEELSAYQLAQPPPPDYYPLLGNVIYGTFVLLAVVPNACWWLLRDEPRLSKGRSLGVNALTSFGYLLGCSSIDLRWAAFDWNTNATSMACWWVATGVLSGVGLIALTGCLRVYLFCAPLCQTHCTPERD